MPNILGTDQIDTALKKPSGRGVRNGETGQELQHTFDLDDPTLVDNVFQF